MPSEISNPTSDDRANQAQDRRGKTSGAMDSAKEKASDGAHKARKKAEESLSDQKRRTTQQFESVSSALRDTSANLRERQEDRIAEFADTAAEQVDRLSGYLSNRSVGELMEEVENIARREPALFLGGAALLGIVGARFLKSSERRRMQTSDRGDSRYFEREPMDRDRGPTRDTGRTRTYEREPYRTTPPEVRGSTL